MKLATFNVNSLRKRLPIVLPWLRDHAPDVLCLQETKVQDHEFPLAAFEGSGYHVNYRGMKAYNGVAILSREKPQAVHYGLKDGPEADEPRLARADFKNFSVINTYIPQGYLIDSPKYAYKLEWYKRLRNYFDRHFSPKDNVLWCGDMNVAPEAQDVHSPEKHLNHVCFHEDAREGYQKTLAWGFTDVFRKLYPARVQYTFWDYRQPDSLAANRGWRIDHIVATASMAQRCAEVEVDILPRQAESPSDHTVLWARFDQ